MKRHSHPKPEVEQLTGRLREGARKVTGPRLAILSVLQEQEHPLPIAAIHKLARGSAGDLATVYRAMKMLERMGMVKRFDFGDGMARYELERHAEGGHHHHLICRDCAKVVEIEECFPRELELRIAKGNGFARISHKLEFFGICPACQ